MTTFNDLLFEAHPNHGGGVRAEIVFENGFGASVIKTPYSYGGDSGLYELAVIDRKGNLRYDTYITDDVLGYLSEDKVTELLGLIESL